MKTWLAPLLAHYQQTTTALAIFWKVVRTDGVVFAVTDHDQPIVVDGLTYLASQGLTVSTVQNTDGFNVTTMDVTAFLSVSTEAQIEAGIWDESVVTMFEARWDSPPAALAVNAVNILRHGILGRIDRQNLKFSAEIRGLATRLETHIGRVFSPTCPWRHAVWNGSTYVAEAVCGVSLVGFIHTGTVTSVGTDARMTFSASALSPAAGYFNEGLIAMTSGSNASLGQLSVMDVRRWENQQFSLHRPLPYAVAVGNTFSAVRGDDKTFGTCELVFNNVLNFGGYPYLPGIDKVLENSLLKVPLPPQAPPSDGNPAYSHNEVGNTSGE